MKRVIRKQYRAQILNPEESRLPGAFDVCRERAKEMIREGKAMTIALYRYGRQLFLYAEFLDEEANVEMLFSPLSELLSLWPQKDTQARWVPMYPVFWHAEPRGEEDWKRHPAPGKRRGRIAYLRHESMFEYVEYHHALVREGLLAGDRYQLISMHEDVLFSYLEEPRTPQNIRRLEGAQSKVIEGWMQSDPDSHFLHLPGSEGQNFLFIPTVFAVGESDIQMDVQ